MLLLAPQTRYSSALISTSLLASRRARLRALRAVALLLHVPRFARRSAPPQQPQQQLSVSRGVAPYVFIVVVPYFV